MKCKKVNKTAAECSTHINDVWTMWGGVRMLHLFDLIFVRFWPVLNGQAEKKNKYKYKW